MGFQFNGTQANVTLSGSTGLPQINASQTFVSAKLTNAANGSTIYTVTAGKTFYCTGFSPQGGGAGSVHIVSNCNLNPFSPSSTDGASCTMSGNVIAVFSAGTAITITSGAAGNYDMIWGYEV